MHRIAGNGLPRQCAHWFAMTVVFDDFRINSGAESYQISCHCEEPPSKAATWQSASPASEGCCGPIGRHWGFTTVRQTSIYRFDAHRTKSLPSRGDFTNNSTIINLNSKKKGPEGESLRAEKCSITRYTTERTLFIRRADHSDRSSGTQWTYDLKPGSSRIGRRPMPTYRSR